MRLSGLVGPRSIATALLGLLCSTTLTGCIAFGYSSRGGWFVWPGGSGLLILILVIVFLLRRR